MAGRGILLTVFFFLFWNIYCIGNQVRAFKIYYYLATKSPELGKYCVTPFDQTDPKSKLWWVRWHRNQDVHQHYRWSCSIRVHPHPNHRHQHERQRCDRWCCACQPTRSLCRWCWFWQHHQRRPVHCPNRRHDERRRLVHHVPCPLDWNGDQQMCNRWCCHRTRGCGNRVDRVRAQKFHRLQWHWNRPAGEIRKMKIIINIWLCSGFSYWFSLLHRRSERRTVNIQCIEDGVIQNYINRIEITSSIDR